MLITSTAASSTRRIRRGAVGAGGVTLDFYSDWSTATGATSNALRDGGLWDAVTDAPGGGDVFEVVDGDAVGWTLTPNCLKFERNAPSTDDGMVNVNLDYFPNRTNFYLRFFMRFNATGGHVAHSPSFPQSGGLVWSFRAETDGVGGGWSPGAGVFPLHASNPVSNFGYELSNGTTGIWPFSTTDWIRYESFFEFASDSGGNCRYRCYPRVYNMAGTLLYDVEDFADTEQPTVSLQEVYDEGRFYERTVANANAATNMAFGCGEGAFSQDGAQLFHAAVATSTEGWIGDQLG